MATQNSKPFGPVSSPTTPTGKESVTPVTQPSGVRALSASMSTKPDRKSEAIQRAQVGSLMGANGNNEPQNKTPKKQTPTSGARPKRYALEMWVEIETSGGMHTAPEEDSYGVDFAIDTINRAYPGCTGMYLGVVGHMLAFYGKKTNPRAGLLLDQAIIVSKAITNIPTWIGYFAVWRVNYISISEASEILAGCKRIEKESLRWARWELQQWFSALQVDSTLSATAKPFQLRVAPQSSQEDNVPRSLPGQCGLVGSSPDSPMRRAFPCHHQSSDEDEGVSTDTSIADRPLCRRCGIRRSHSSWSNSNSDGTRSSGGRCKKKDGFLSKIQIPEFGGKKGHTHDVAGAFWQWAHCITYYHDNYEDSYLMPLVVSSLMRDASNVFDWICSLNSGVHEEVRHVLDSEIAKNGGNLTPQQMYEAVKRYETYVAHNKRLKGKGAVSTTSQPKASGHTSGYKPRFHKTTAFAATILEVEDEGPGRPESSPQEGADAYGNESSQEDDEGLYIPSYLEEAIPDDPVLQVKMARAMQAQEVETQRCFTCGQLGHLQRDHWKYEEKNGNGPLQPKGPPLNKSARERVKVKLLPSGQGMSQTNPPK